MSKSRLGIKVIAPVLAAFKKRWLSLLVGFAFAILCFIVLEVMMKPVSRSSYCGSNCHEMKVAYQSWELSAHGANKYGFRVECIDCHLAPKDDYFTHIAAKAFAGGKDTFLHYFGGDYDVEKNRQKVLNHIPNKICLHCHDDLLARPGTSVAGMVHTAVLAQPEAPEYKCVKCHEDVGHQRETKLFSP
jgi:nitrate/TMAO reductase-like tetraheme cytochrome c subunit